MFDLVVLGRVDACWVCQHGPPPQVSYTRVLQGTAPGGQAMGQLAVVELGERVLPEGSVPMYTSQQEEIVLLRRVAVEGMPDVDAYRVEDVLEATPANLARFTDESP
jgi:hypothetical protein